MNYYTRPEGQRRIFKFELLNFKSIENLVKFEKGSVNKEDKFNREVDKNCTPFYIPLISCIKELQRVVFLDRKRWMREDPELYSHMKSVLQQARENLVTSEYCNCI